MKLDTKKKIIGQINDIGYKTNPIRSPLGPTIKLYALTNRAECYKTVIEGFKQRPVLREAEQHSTKDQIRKTADCKLL